MAKEKGFKIKLNFILKTSLVQIVISSSILIIFVGLIFYLSYSNKQLQDRITKIDSYIQSATKKTERIKLKSLNTNKYLIIWDDIPEQRKKLQKNISKENLQTIIESKLNQYDFSNINIEHKGEEKIDTFAKIFDDAEVKHSAQYNKFSIKFNAIIDSEIFEFISDMQNNNEGYIIISKMRIEKTKELNIEDMKQINAGKIVYPFSIEMDLEWYVGIEKQ